MRPILLSLLALSLSAPTFALERQLADGDWNCSVGGPEVGSINIDGESYRYTRLDGRKRAGDLALELDGTTYYVESGVLRDELEITGIRFEMSNGEESLMLSSGDADRMFDLGFCLRPAQ